MDTASDGAVTPKTMVEAMIRQKEEENDKNFRFHLMFGPKQCLIQLMSKETDKQTRLRGIRRAKQKWIETQKH